MNSEYLAAYQSLVDESERITSTKITKVSYLIKLKAQRNSISDLEGKHKEWAYNEYILKEHIT